MKTKTRSIFIVLIVVTVCAVTFRQRQKPTRLFRKLLVSPIPASIKGLKAFGSSGWGCHEYVLKFDIADKDLVYLLALDHFREIGFAEYSGGLFTYGENRFRTFTFALFAEWHGQTVPPWFDLNEWESHRVYLTKEELVGYKRVRLILFNEQLNQAFFIDWQAKGSGVGKIPMNAETRERLEKFKRDKYKGESSSIYPQE